MSETVKESSRSIDVAGEFDVVVCGAGPAGIAAALAAARNGANTLVLEAQGCLGGVWTSGYLCWIIDSKNKNGIMKEIVYKLTDMGATRRTFENSRDFAYDPEQMKYLLDNLFENESITTQLHTRVVSVVKDGSNQITHVITESKSGRQAWKAKVFVDSTGDGDVGYFAQCNFAYGREGNSETQPMSLQAIATGFNKPELEDYIINGSHGKEDMAKENMLKEVIRSGVDPSYATPSIIRLSDNLFIYSVNHQYGVSAFDAMAIAKATARGRKEIFETAKALKSLGGIWSDIHIVGTAAYIGVRDGRRIKGKYTVREDDMKTGVRHDDAVCRVTFGVDVHSTQKLTGKGYSSEGIKVKPYDIPYRALVADDVEGLLTAGRCISGSFRAHASYRVTGNSVPLGQVAGTAAALCAKDNCLPSKLEWSILKSALEKDGYTVQ